MPKYLIKFDIQEEITAEDEEDAKGQFFEMIENEPQQTVASYLSDKLKVEELN